jgi:hypothetical protein
VPEYLHKIEYGCYEKWKNEVQFWIRQQWRKREFIKRGE